MFKIIIEDSDLNEAIYYKKGIDVDIFVERFLGASTDPDSLVITTELMSKEQIEALKLLHETDWYSCRKVDAGTGIPINITEDRAAARFLL